APLAAWLLARRDAAALGALAGRLDAGRDGVLARLAGELGRAEGRARVGACNEALHEVEGELARGEGAGAGRLRACLFLTAWAAVMSLALRRGASVELIDAVALGLGAGVCLGAFERASDEGAREARRALDRWVEAALKCGGGGPSLPVDRPE
ncbi:MAG TPA: hypothetical protein VFS00_14815, partial [Polyangiaceae bacterium]|nr:hypothetical protein [Polyangiaceae bacterium]